jgi:dTDP-4-amino-4,6-dideoxygalactose transaminase
VFCPSFTFAATAEIVPHVGATPVFVDVDRETFNICPESLKRAVVAATDTGLKPAGIVPVDLFGLPADYDTLEAIARENGMWIIADSAQGFGATHKGRTTGSIGDIATTSFFPAKPLGCYGDGGAVFTNDDELAALVASLRVHGKGSDKYDNVRVGVNSRLDTLQAAILLEKLAIYPDEIASRQKVAARYSDALRQRFGVPVVPEGSVSVWAQYTLRSTSGEERDAAMAALKAEGIPSVVYYPMPLHRQQAYRDFPADPQGLATSEMLAKTVFSLPMHPYLEPETQDRIIRTLLQA